MSTWIIKDWAGNHCFPDQEFTSFEDAWGFLYDLYPDDDDLPENEQNLQEYEVWEVIL